MLDSTQTQTQPKAQPESKRKPGRPRKYAPWFPAVAKAMADGTTLRKALLWNRIILSERDIRRLYQSREFVRLYKIERHVYMHSNYGRRAQTELERHRNMAERMFR